MPKYLKNMEKKDAAGTVLSAAALPVLLHAELLSSLAYTQSHLNFIPPRPPYSSVDSGEVTTAAVEAATAGGRERSSHGNDCIRTWMRKHRLRCAGADVPAFLCQKFVLFLTSNGMYSQFRL
ncbi:hypothetical protein VQ056_18055 [Paenibacillus sp. JTLBN-2024]